MEKKAFWASFVILGIAADLYLPIWWALFATIPIGFVSWWIAYRSGWFSDPRRHFAIQFAPFISRRNFSHATFRRPDSTQITIKSCTTITSPE